MLYIKFTKDYLKTLEKSDKYPKIVAISIYLWKMLTSSFFIQKVENGEIIILPKLNRKIKKKLCNFLKVYSVKTVCLSSNLKNTDVEKIIKDLKIRVLDGKWLYPYLIQNILEFIVDKKHTNLNNEEISVLTKKVTELDIENINLLAKECKSINVVTENERKIKVLEEKLYSEDGIILNITNNYSKALVKSNIIINVDFEEEKINKFALPRKAVIINLENDVKILNKGFDGINVYFYKLNFNNENVPEILKEFDNEILCESLIYKNTRMKNILKEINGLKVSIQALIGAKGEIKIAEYGRLEGKKNKKFVYSLDKLQK